MNRYQTKDEADRERLSVIVSRVLLVGVLVSGAVLFAGMVLMLVEGMTGYQEPFSTQLLTSKPGSLSFPTTIGGVLAGALALKPVAVIELGAILLILTPVVRVASSAVLFLAQKDYLYTLVTAAVFVILVVSILFVH
jgi:uncharacterized membrane protein